MELYVTAESKKTLQGGEALFREGDVADCAYVVERGQLEISTTSEHGKVVLKTLGSGELVGEMGVIDSSPRTATATAVGETHLMAVTRDQFTERLSRADSILQLLVNMLLERYRSGLSMVKQRRDPEPREAVVADELIHEYVRDGMDKIRLESELREALTSEQLQVRYQPILDLGNGTIAGFEALTRWQHPVRGAISPGLFIALAEETSLIVPVGLYVLEQACRDIQAIAGDTGEGDDSGPLYVSINVSARQIRDPQFLDQAVEVARAHDLDPGRLLLEITEGLLIDLDQAAEWVTRARSLGFRVALDDFGTGYSSLDTLHRLDLDVVKIDRAFVTPLSENPRSRDLMRGIVAMMKSLRTEIVVEGIETRRQLEFARALDCEYCQGFLIGRSLDIAEARALLAEGVPA